MVCVLAKLGYIFAVGSLGCTQKSFGEVAKFTFWARTKLHKQVLQKMATPVYYATHCSHSSGGQVGGRPKFSLYGQEMSIYGYIT